MGDQPQLEASTPAILGRRRGSIAKIKRGRRTPPRPKTRLAGGPLRQNQRLVGRWLAGTSLVDNKQWDTFPGLCVVSHGRAGQALAIRTQPRPVDRKAAVFEIDHARQD